MSNLELEPQEIKTLIIEILNFEGVKPEDISGTEDLFGNEGLSLDSIDALEIGVGIQKRYGIKDQSRRHGTEGPLSQRSNPQRVRRALAFVRALIMENEKVYDQIVDYLVTAFAIPREDIRPDANLFEQLNLDSIDAVDLMVRLQEITDRKVSPEQFESVRTVQDVIDLVGRLENQS